MSVSGIRQALAWYNMDWTWKERWGHRKEAGYTIKEDLEHIWRKWLVWKILAIIPRPIKYYVVVQVAVKNERGNPGYVTAEKMLKKYEQKVV